MPQVLLLRRQRDKRFSWWRPEERKRRRTYQFSERLRLFDARSSQRLVRLECQRHTIGMSASESQAKRNGCCVFDRLRATLESRRLRAGMKSGKAGG